MRSRVEGPCVSIPQTKGSCPTLLAPFCDRVGIQFPVILSEASSYEIASRRTLRFGEIATLSGSQSTLARDNVHPAIFASAPLGPPPVANIPRSFSHLHAPPPASARYRSATISRPPRKPVHPDASQPA